MSRHGRTRGPIARGVKEVDSVTLFPDVIILAPYRSRARRELRRVSLELEYERRRANALTAAATRDLGLALKASAAEVRVAALRARAAQLRRSA
jgi:hypothetical protein